MPPELAPSRKEILVIVTVQPALKKETSQEIIMRLNLKKNLRKFSRTKSIKGRKTLDAAETPPKIAPEEVRAIK